MWTSEAEEASEVFYPYVRTRSSDLPGLPAGIGSRFRVQKLPAALSKWSRPHPRDVPLGPNPPSPFPKREGGGGVNVGHVFNVNVRWTRSAKFPP